MKHRPKTVEVEIPSGLLGWLSSSAHDNERTLAQEIRYWVRRAYEQQLLQAAGKPTPGRFEVLTDRPAVSEER